MESLAILFTGIVIGIAFAMAVIHLSEADRFSREKRELDRDIREAIQRARDRERRTAARGMN